MNKTLNINLAGQAFTIDENAYQLLNDYLTTVSHVFNSSENEEVVTDIETRISEVFSLRVEEGKNIISLSDVEAVITRIGNPEEFVEETIISSDEEKVIITETENIMPPPLPPSASTPQKRLYRDSKNGMIGGVCAGIGEYLNIDITWVRLITVALCFVSLSAILLVYLILWFVLPDAVTPYQRMQLTGESPTLQNIGQSVKNFFKNNNDPKQSPVPEATEQRNNGIADSLAKFFGIIAKIILVFLLIICIPCEIGLAIALICAFIGLIVCSTAAGTAFFMEFTPAIEVNFVIWTILLVIGLILIIGIPLFIFIRLLLNNGNQSMKKSTKIVLLISWIISIILIGASLTYLYISHYDTINQMIAYSNTI